MGSFADVNSSSERDNLIIEIEDGLGLGHHAGVTSDNRLKVESTINLVDQRPSIYFNDWLYNGTDPDMSVNGSVTNVDFSFVPASGETWNIERLFIFILDPNASSPDRFGSITRLTNGLQILVRSNGTEYLFTNIRENMDIGRVFNSSFFPSSAANGFYNNNNFFSGSIDFKSPIKLKNSTGDYLKAKVRDNLTAIDYLRMGFHIWRDI